MEEEKRYSGYTAEEIIKKAHIITGEQLAIDIMKKLAEENIRFRNTVKTLIKLLQKADGYADKLEWKLFWETKDKIVEEVINKNKK